MYLILIENIFTREKNKSEIDCSYIYVIFLFFL